MNYAWRFSSSTLTCGDKNLPPPCQRAYHLRCYSVRPEFSSTVLCAPSYGTGGNRARKPDARLRSWVCETCVRRSQQIPDSHPEAQLIEALEIKRNMSVWNRHTDSTLSNIQTGYNKITAFEERFGVKIIDRPAPIWPKPSKAILLQWCVELESIRLNRRTGQQLSLSATNCIHEFISFHEFELDALHGNLVRVSKAAVMHSHGHLTSSTLLSQNFRKGFGAMKGKTVRRAIPFPPIVVFEIQEFCEDQWDEQLELDPSHTESKLICHAIASLAVSNALHWLGMPRPNEYFSGLMWGGNNGISAGMFFDAETAAHHMLPRCLRVTITTRTKTDTYSIGSTRWLATQTASGINLERWLLRLKSTTQQLGLSTNENTSLFQRGTTGGRWNSADFWNELVKPTLQSLRHASPPCQSTRFLQLADPSLIQWRSYRRGAYQQLRRSGVSPTISDFMMRWAQRKNTRNGNEETYDDLCPDDTVNATSKL